MDRSIKILVSVLIVAIIAFLGYSQIKRWHQSAMQKAVDQEKSDCESSKFEIKEVEAVKALVIKSDVPMAEIGDAMGAVYGQLFEYIEANDIQPAGPPFTVYLKWDPEGNVVFESGIRSCCGK